MGVTQMALDPQVWTTLGTAAGAVATTLGGVWIWLQKQRKDLAAVKADVAQSKSEETVADAQQLIYKTLVARLTALEEDVKGVRAELVTERAHSRSLEQKLARLELWITQQGLTLPLL